MTLCDDGVGLPRAPDGRRSGLANLERRIVELGGALSFPPVEQGTRVEMSLPLEPAQPTAAP